MDKEMKQRMRWGAFGPLMQKNRLFAMAVYLGMSGSFLFLFLSLITSLGVFIWLMNLSLIIWVAMGVLAMVFNLITYFKQKKEER